MSRFTRWSTAALAVAAAGAAVLAATPASAHGAPFTVTAGSAAAGTSVPVTLTTSGTSPQFLWKDTTTNVSIGCSSATLHGAVVPGQSGSRVGTISGAQSTFSGCIGPAGLKYLVTGVGTWTIDVSDSTAGTSVVSVGNLRAHLVATAGPTCAWDFAAPTGTFTSSTTATTDPGTLNATYRNSTTTLSVPPSSPGTLGLWNVKGGGGNTYCVAASVFKQGDRVSWRADWTVTADTAANNPVAIN